MDHVIDVGEEWGAALAAFLGDRARRLLHVLVDRDTRDGVLRTLYRCCRERTFGHLVLVLRSPADRSTGWDLRTIELALQYESLRRALSRLGKAELPEIGPELLPDPIGSAGLARFCEVLGRVRAGLSSTHGDLVIVLAPCARAGSDDLWRDDVALLAAPIVRGTGIRLIVVEPAPAPTRTALEKAGADTACVVLDSAAVRREIVDRLRAQATAPVGASGPRALGGAGPAIAPPPRPGRPAAAPLDAATWAALTPDVRLALDPAAADAIRRGTARALAAISEGDPGTAIASQRDVVAITEAAGADAATADALLLLGTLAIAGRRERDAREILERTVVVALRAGVVAVACQAIFGSAAVEALGGRHAEAAATYRRAAVLARDHGAIALAIEGLRACGACLVRAGRPVESVGAWREAVDLARAGASPEVPASAAPHLARRLATTCEEHGLDADARAFRDLAVELASERGHG